MAANKPDPKSLRDNPAAIAEYLNEALAKNDLPTVLQALKFVVRAQNVMALAEVTGMRRESLYRSFSGDTNPTIDRVLGLLAALDVGLVAQPLRKRTKPLMAKKRSRKSL
jgi:probable addiction module antidote protein